ncbi:recombinase RecT [Eubacterium sp. LMAG:50]|uniref:recombinase RecT n=1 Tax=Eubacterium sp. LMAG:50 TaxID=1969563 RepID=UPI0025BE8456|nr:recombinase RecT [Eubacterium sp. LMAG:50]
MAVSNSLAKSQQKTSLTAYLSNDAVKNQINSIVGGKNGTRFISSIISAVNANASLQECTNASILSAALLGESLNLSPSPQLGQYYMVPFKNNNAGVKVAQFQLGYKGYIQLALRTGRYRKLNVLAIKEGELISFNPLEEEIEVKLIADEVEREKAETMGYYAMFEYTDGFKKALYWSKEKMKAHAMKYSQGYAADVKKGTKWTFWSKDFDGMAYKTMLRQIISKWGSMSIDMQTALDSDMAVINEDGTKEYVEIDEGMIVEGSVEEVQNVENKEVADVQVEAEPQPQTTAEAVQQSFFQ